MPFSPFDLTPLSALLAEPLSLVWVLAAVGVLWHVWRRRWRAAVGWYAASALWLLALGWEPVTTLAFRSLENQYAPLKQTPEGVAGLVILGGGDEWDVPQRHDPHVLPNHSAERLSQSWRLGQMHPQWTALFSGGYGWLQAKPGEPSEARRLLAYWQNKGEFSNPVLLEERARNTAENAMNSAALLGKRAQQPWLLVTSSWHMPRAMSAFERAGVNVIAYPVDYRTQEPIDWTRYSLQKGRQIWHLVLVEHIARLGLVFQMR